ncbi:MULTISPECIES: multidrug ABC transporter ATP-binding protein [Lactobacillus]|uniref:multidrug ABC transporter ATP-binding protein n=1 Tax=Lactobacillus TaxID=1578 RepID=UPI000A473261|nr:MULTISPECIES: multidrug ABC transporter ATP-binding protein [Lactobacillus]
MLANEAIASLDPVLSRKIHNTLLQEYSGTVTEVAHHLIPKEKMIINKIIHFKN